VIGEVRVSGTSVKDVAARAGVSVGTVSNVLNRPETVPPATVVKVRAAIEELGFVRNDAARQLRAGRSRSIGLIVLDGGNPFFTDLARGAELEAESTGTAVVMGNSDQDPAREAHYLDLFEEQRVRGILISPVGEIGERLERLRLRGTPAVLVDRKAELPDFASVSVDDVAGGELAAEHLIGLGRRRLAFVGGPLGLRQVGDRLEGARRAARRAGIELRVIEIPQLTVINGREAGVALLRETESEWPDAVFAGNDLVAMGLLQAFRMTERIPVPERIALVGYDDIAFASAAVVPITSIRQPSELIGRTAVELIEAQIAGSSPIRHVEFQPELVVRASTIPTFTETPRQHGPV